MCFMIPAVQKLAHTLPPEQTEFKQNIKIIFSAKHWQVLSSQLGESSVWETWPNRIRAPRVPSLTYLKLKWTYNFCRTVFEQFCSVSSLNCTPVCSSRWRHSCIIMSALICSSKLVLHIHRDIAHTQSFSLFLTVSHHWVFRISWDSITGSDMPSALGLWQWRLW